MGVGSVIKKTLQGLTPSSYKAVQKTDEIAARMDDQMRRLPEIDMEAQLRQTGNPNDVESPPPIQPSNDDITQPGEMGLYGDPLPGERGLNIENIQTEDDIEAYMDSVSNSIPAGTRTWDEVAGSNHREALESMIGMSPYAGFSDRQLFALRTELLLRAEDLHKSAKWLKANPDQANPQMYADLVKSTNDYVAFQRYAQGASAEAARALNSMKMLSKSDSAAKSRDINNILMAIGGEKRGKQLADMLGDDAITSSDMLAGVARDAVAGRIVKPIVEIWVNGLLSGPSTWLINSISNTMVSAYETMAIKPLATAIGGVRHAISGGEGGAKALETTAEAYGAYQGWVDGMRLFAKEIANKDYHGFGKIDKAELDSWHYVSSKNWNMDPQSKSAQAVDFIGDWYVRLPGRILQGQDQWFKAMSYRKNLNAAAYRQALMDVDEGLITDTEVGKRINQYVNNPTENMHMSSLERAEYETFTNPPDKMGGLVGDAAMALHKFSYRHPLFKFVAPFVRTPANLLNYAVENSLPPLRQKFRDDLMAGGARSDMAMARMSMASMLGMTIYSMHDEGQLTGDAPDNPKVRELMKEQGISPNSIKIGDKWWRYDRADPLGMMIAAYSNVLDAAAYSQEETGAQELVLGMIVGMAQDFTDKSYMIGISELMNVLNSDEASVAKSGSNYLTGMMSSFVPSWSNYMARSLDVDGEGKGVNRGAYKYTLENMGMWDAFSKKARARTPFMREDLPIVRNWKGEKSLRDQGHFGWEAFPIKTMNPKDDPVSYQMYKAGIQVPRPRDVQTLSTGERVSLLGLDRNQGHVYWKYAEFIGKSRYELAKAVSSPLDEYNEMNPEDKGPGGIQHELFRAAMHDGAAMGRIDWELWYRKEAENSPGWVVPDTPEWLEMTSRLDKVSEEAYVPPGSEPTTQDTGAKALLRIMQ